MGNLEITIGSGEERERWHEVVVDLGKIAILEDLRDAVQRVETIMAADGSLEERIAAARAEAAKFADGSPLRRDLIAIHDHDAEIREQASATLLADQPVARVAELIGRRSRALWQLPRHLGNGDGDSDDDGDTALAVYEQRITGYATTEWVPAPSPSFCVRPNPVVAALRSQAEVNLRKLRNCRSIAGLELHVAPYPEATAATAATGDGLPSPEPHGFQPLPYRYATLIERTKQLVELARQLEQSMLGAIQSADHARYEELKARHDMALARAEIRLRDLQLVQATDGVRSAELQRDPRNAVGRSLPTLINAGVSTNEEIAIGFLAAAAGLHVASAASSFYGVASIEGVIDFGSGGMASGLSSLAATSSTLSQVSSTYASFERRAQDWQLQRDLGAQDVRLGEQQIRLAQDQVQIVVQERVISSLQLDHAQEVLDFLTARRVGTAELYEWMSGLLEQIYRFFLQQATSIAKLAELQLAFERQERPAAFIRGDYWHAAGDGRPVNSDVSTLPDRHGLTGSARLLRDVTELDQYAFRTEQRKLQLTKTISLGQLDPIAFQRFRETGVMTFATPQALFDRDFPGHYLRLIKRVRTSVIGLIPPTHGIHATLSTSGPSRVVIGGDTFETVVIPRSPESVALTSPINATGLFELNPQPEMLAPFEGMGVDQIWEFSMPKASNLFDYRAVMDVLVTIEYTALGSYDYREQVVKQLDRRLVVDRPFLFRHQFADAWYDLHNPELFDDEQQRMVVRFRTARDDFPPNIEALAISHVALYFGRADGQTEEVEVASLAFTQNGTTVTSGSMTSANGIVSTRRANGGSLAGVIGLAPIGEWELSLNYANPPEDAAIRERFKDGEIEDVLLVVTYAGETAEWPE